MINHIQNICLKCTTYPFSSQYVYCTVHISYKIITTLISVGLLDSFVIMKNDVKNVTESRLLHHHRILLKTITKVKINIGTSSEMYCYIVYSFKNPISTDILRVVKLYYTKK